MKSDAWYPRRGGTRSFARRRAPGAVAPIPDLPPSPRNGERTADGGPLVRETNCQGSCQERTPGISVAGIPVAGQIRSGAFATAGRVVHWISQQPSRLQRIRGHVAETHRHPSAIVLSLYCNKRRV